MSHLNQLLSEIPETTSRNVVYHLLLMDYIKELYEELALQMEKEEIGYHLKHVPYYEANSDFRLIECLQWGIKIGYEL